MRLSAPRIPPVKVEDMSADQARLMGAFAARPGHNIVATLAHEPEPLAPFMEWGQYILSPRNSLPERQLEIAILRVGYRCRAGYEFTHHSGIGATAGLKPDEIDRLKRDELIGWDAADAALIAAADELIRDRFITDPTWQKLSGHFSRRQCMDLVYTIGQYGLVCSILNTYGVQLEDGHAVDPDFAPAPEI